MSDEPILQTLARLMRENEQLRAQLVEAETRRWNEAVRYIELSLKQKLFDIESANKFSVSTVRIDYERLAVLKLIAAINDAKKPEAEK